MNKLFNKKTGIFLACGMIMLFVIVGLIYHSVDSNNSMDDGTQPTFTLFVYMCASNLESSYGAATANIDEMLSANIPDNVNVIIQAGGTRKWQNNYFSSVITERAQIKNGEVVSLDRIPKESMGKTETLSDFIKWGVSNYPADDYGIIFWDHGGGSLKGVCFDELYDMDGLTLSELDECLSYGSSLIEGKFEFVGFDACLMANYETACIVEPFAKMMVASEENEPLGGWDYVALLEGLSKLVGDTGTDEKTTEKNSKSRDDFYKRILTAYADKCEIKEKKTYTLSVIDLSKFALVEKEFSSFATELSNENVAQVARCAFQSICFGTNDRNLSTNLIDLHGFASVLGNTDLPNAITKCTQNVSGEYRADAKGLSIYFPVNNIDNVDEYQNNNKRADCLDIYRRYLKDNFQNAVNNQILIVNSGSDDNGKLKVKISEGSVKNVARVCYKLYRFIQYGNIELVYEMGEDSDIETDGKGNYVVAFEGRWVTFGGHYINSVLERDTQEYTEYSSSVIVNGVNAYMRFVYDKSTRQINLEGYTPIDNNENTGDEAISGRIVEFETGDEVRLMYVDATDLGHELVEGSSLVYTEQTKLSVESFPPGYYQYNVYFYDAYSTEYRSATTVIYWDGTKTEIKLID